MKKIKYIFVFVLFFPILSYYIGYNSALNIPIEAEYTIQLVNQDSVKIYSLDNQKVYEVSPQQITETLIKDNL